MTGASPSVVRLLHVTDPHLMRDESLEIYDVNTARSLRRVLDQALGSGGARVDAVLVTGDIADDRTAEAYTHFRAQLARFGLPVLCLPGNHDRPELMARLLEGDGFRYCARTDLAGWSIVALDSHVPGDPAGRLSPGELARLDVELRETRGRHVAVCLHHPPLPVGSVWLDGVGLLNAPDLLAVIDAHPHVRVVVSGHVHQAFDATRGPVRYLTTPSTCAQFTPRTEQCLMDLRPPGYRWIELRGDGTVDTQVAWLEDWTVARRPTDDRARFMD